MGIFVRSKPVSYGLAIKYLEVNLNKLQIYALSDHLAL